VESVAHPAELTALLSPTDSCQIVAFGAARASQLR
jgi:hypothetical protein